ncbi:pilus assembly protein TadG-related protein [Sediminimonas sp.]|uniref:TadE/TadG family type IV pilus assembly protein n=1 Tax=Sediminimonas sp. TaxID=2823379 RepID=UPI0025CF5174|nr:pilus assembly protein TadG-related protein [Sediminimonas sp.]
MQDIAGLAKRLGHPDSYCAVAAVSILATRPSLQFFTDANGQDRTSKMNPASREKVTSLVSAASGQVTAEKPVQAMGGGRSVAAFARSEDGAVAIIAGLAIPVLLGFAGLSLEYGQLLVVRAEAQRTADLASHAGAVAYSRTGDTNAMTDAARGVARLNGFGADEIAVVLDSSFQTASGAAVRATITTPKPLYLPSLVGGDTSVDVAASAVAGASAGQPACVQALNPNGGGITLSGATTLQADDCAIASNAEVAAPCGTSIITSFLSYDSANPPDTGSCSTIRSQDGEATQITRRPTPDPLEGSDAVIQARAQMARTAALSPPDDVVVASGPDIDFGWNQQKTIDQAEAVGCTASFTSSGSTWTFSCSGLSTVNIGDITLGGGLTLRFNPGGAETTTYDLSGGIDNRGSKMTFAGGIYNVAGGIITGGGSVTEFGAGTYRVGRSDKNCDGGRYSICNTSEMTFEGPSDFVLPGGVRNTGGSALTLGTGNGNSFRIGPSSAGDAISTGGGSETIMGDADGGVFEAVGWIDGGRGGSCLVLPSTELHEIRGSVISSGAVRFGSGVYAIDGYMHLGGNGGGSAYCGGETISIEAEDTTFLISANGPEPKGGKCHDQAFCLTAGYSDVHFTAPQSGPFTDLAFVGPLDPSRPEGALFAGGAGGSEVSGAFYFPTGPITTSGGASASGGDGGCLQLIGAEILMSGGTSISSECDLPGSASQGRVVLLE